MTLFQKFKNPIIWILGLIIKLSLRKLFFSNISNDDFKRLFSYTLELLPNETFINIFKIFFSTIRIKPSNILDVRLLNEAVTHSIPTEQRLDVLSRLKFLFLFLMLGNILKRTLFLVKTIILLPFKLGVYGFIASLIGIKPDYLLSFFDVFKFNLPSWTYNKLLELHLSWMSWFRNILQIKSINTDLEKPLTIPKIKNPYLNVDPVIEPKEETYLYLTKKQWFYLSITVLTALGAYFGYTGGIPFKQVFEWNGDLKSGTNKEGEEVIIPSQSGIAKKAREAKWKEVQEHFALPSPSWYDTIKSWPGKLIEKLNPFNWWRTADEFEIEEQLDKNKYEQFKKREAAEIHEYEARLKKDNQYEKKSNFLTKYWYSHDKIQPENTSPTHSDPEKQKEYNKLFPKSEEPSTSKSSVEPLKIKESTTQVQNPTTPPISNLYSVPEANESTETVTQSNVWSEIKGNSFKENPFEDSIPSDVTASELQPLTRPRPSYRSDSKLIPLNSPFSRPFNRPDLPDSYIPSLDRPDSSIPSLDRPDSSSSGSDSDREEAIHTYPPRPKGKEKMLTYFPGGGSLKEGLSIARGFNENIDLKEININKGSIMFSSSFTDRFRRR